MTEEAQPSTAIHQPDAPSPTTTHQKQRSGRPPQTGTKRRANNSSSNEKQPRSKRTRYVNRACNTCARRKVRCNGEMPCERCVAQGDGNECSYQVTSTSSSPHRDATSALAWSQLQSLSAEVLSMRQQLSAAQQTISPQAPPRPHRDSNPPPPQPPPPPTLPIHPDSTVETSSLMLPLPSAASDPPRQPFLTPPSSHGHAATPGKASISSSIANAPTNGQLAFHVAKQRFDPLGMQNSSSWEPNLRSTRGGSTLIDALLVKDPLWRLDAAKVEQCLVAWQEGWGAMTPLVPVGWAQSTWALTQAALDTARQHPASTADVLAAVDVLLKPDTAILKMILANAMALEASEGFGVARQLYESLGEARDDALWGHPTLDKVVLLVLIALFNFHMSDQLRGTRIISIAARLCLELGLHSNDPCQKTATAMFDGDKNSSLDPNAVFWSVFVTERRLSTYVGTPFVLQENDVDENLPRPAASHVYLNAMVNSAALLGTVARQTTILRNLDLPLRLAEIDYQDYQWLQWAKELPHCDMNITAVPDYRTTTTADQVHPFIVAVLQARSHQLRGLIYRPVLYSSSRIQAHARQARTAVAIAKESVQFLAMLNQNTSFVRSHALFYQDLLIEAFISVLLAVINAPGEFNCQLEAEFYMVLDVLRSLQGQSPSRPHMRETVQHFEAMGPIMGLARSSADSLPIASDMQSHVADAVTVSSHQQDDINASVIPAANNSVMPGNGQNSYFMENVWPADNDARLLHPMGPLSSMCRDEFHLLTDANEDVARLLFDWDTLLQQ